ncbi:MAG TPA: hypothetical protein VMY37_36705 [Thermoguttaceae bacterium]|nr:hypothetical protein [Thermoguttaceae bacterium]
MRPVFHQRWRAAALAGDPQAVDVLAAKAIGPLYRFCQSQLPVTRADATASSIAERRLRPNGACDSPGRPLRLPCLWPY